MEAIKNLDEATALVQRINHRKIVSNLTSVEVVPQLLDEQISLSFDVEGDRYNLSTYAEKSFLRMIGLSRKFLDNCVEDVDLATNAINQARRGAADRARATSLHLSLLNQHDIDLVEAAPNKAILPLNLSEVWEEVAKTDGIIGVSDITVRGRGSYSIRAVTDTTSAPARNVGDATYVGVNLNVNGSVTANPFSYRQWCANGMQSYEDGHVVRVDFADPIVSLRNALATTIDQSRMLVDQFARTDEIVVPNPMEYVMRAIKIAGGTNALRGEVSDRLASEAPNGTLYEILNIVTSFAKSFGADNPRKRDRIEGVAGRIMAMQAGSGRCTNCNSQVGV